MTVAWTMSELQTNEEHEVLESEYCSGYMDRNGKWNTGFYCTAANNEGPLHCCGTSTHKYCCMQKEAFSDESQFDADLPLLLGIILGITTAVTIVMLASCCFCSCCLLYKKRQSHLSDGGPVYQMHCSSTASGVANMYSFSVQNSISTQSSQSVFQQLSIPEPLHVNEANEEMIGSIMDSNHPGFQNNILPTHTFNGDGGNKNWSEIQHRNEMSSGVSHCVDTSLSNKNVQPKPPEASQSKMPRLVALVEDVSKLPIGEQLFVHRFHSYPEERNKTFFSTRNEDSSANMNYRDLQMPESSLIALVGDEVLTERQTVASDTVFDTREAPGDENLYRSTKF